MYNNSYQKLSLDADDILLDIDMFQAKIVLCFLLCQGMLADIGLIGYYSGNCPQDWQQFTNGRGRHIIGQGQFKGTHSDGSPDTRIFRIGEEGGETTHRLTVAEMPNHNHNNGEYMHLLQSNCHRTSSRGGDTSCGEPDIFITARILEAGGDQYHNILSPYIVKKACIKVRDTKSQQIKELKKYNLEANDKLQQILERQRNISRVQMQELKIQSEQSMLALNNTFAGNALDLNSLNQTINGLNTTLFTEILNFKGISNNTTEALMIVKSQVMSLNSTLNQKFINDNAFNETIKNVSENIKDINATLMRQIVSQQNKSRETIEILTTTSQNLNDKISKVADKNNFLDLKMNAIIDLNNLSPSQISSLVQKNQELLQKILFLEQQLQIVKYFVDNDKSQAKIANLLSILALSISSFIGLLTIVLKVYQSCCRQKKEMTPTDNGQKSSVAFRP